jgi:hypothetical protein
VTRIHVDEWLTDISDTLDGLDMTVKKFMALTGLCFYACFVTPYNVMLTLQLNTGQSPLSRRACGIRWGRSRLRIEALLQDGCS